MAVTLARPHVRAPVLMYHRVASEVTITNDVARDLTVTPVTFRAQMDWLPRTGYTPLSHASSLNPVDHGIRLPAKAGVFTFDDGEVDATNVVLPMLA